MLQVNDLHFERNDAVLFTGLNFTLTNNQLLHIIGPNGCGKTSLLKILAGLITPTTGQISGCNSIHYLGHRAGIKLGLTAYENLKNFGMLYGLNLSEKFLENCLVQIGLEFHRDTPSYLLSAGQQRRLLFATLYFSQAKLWLLDEPFSALDKEARVLLENILVKHLNQNGMIILTSHQEFNLPGINDQCKIYL